jgi:alpha-tubulin suppressor-like RCC1 family protein
MCALVTGGGILCWGYNRYGQLGIGNTEDQYSPVAVSLQSGALSTRVYVLCKFFMRACV